jgi:hypothetical protein
MSGHKVRKHSKFSASGSERWLNCAASVELEEGLPSKDSPWSLEGTEAHEVLEVLWKMLYLKSFHKYWKLVQADKDPMIFNALKMIRKVLEVKKTLADPELLIEKRVSNEDIHPEMFGTVDVALVELFGTLHVFDYKYGQGHIVSPDKNTQMIQYGLGLLEEYDWQFEKVVLHINQPRASGKGHKEWEVGIEEMRTYRDLWRKGVARVEKGGNKPFAGHWCHWCKAKSVCPAKEGKRTEKIENMFESTPLEKGTPNGVKKESFKKIASFRAPKKSVKESFKKENPFFGYEDESQESKSKEESFAENFQGVEQGDFY